MSALDFRVRERKEIREFDHNENVEVRAQIIGNETKARVKIEFVSNKTDNTAVAQEILNMLKLSRTDINNLLETEVAQGEELKERQEAKINIGKVEDIRREDRGVRVAGLDLKEPEPVDDRGREVQPGDDKGREVEPGEDRSDRHSEIDIGNNFSEVEFELEFVLRTTSRSEIVDGIFQKLSTLTVENVLNSLEKARLAVVEEKGKQLCFEIYIYNLE